MQDLFQFELHTRRYQQERNGKNTICKGIHVGHQEDNGGGDLRLTDPAYLVGPEI